jgi:hypothetical protein
MNRLDDGAVVDSWMTEEEMRIQGAATGNPVYVFHVRR